MKFKNMITGEELSHEEFVSFVWEEAERQFTEFHDDEMWSDLNKEEQIAVYCEQLEHQLKEREWVQE